MSGNNTCSGASASNVQMGVPTKNVEIPNGNAPKQDLINSIDTAVSTLGPGWKARITPQGGLNDRASGTDNHPNGDAADIQLFYNGQLTTPASNPNEYSRVARAFTAYNNNRGITVGLGGYDSFMHMDQSGWRQMGDNPTAMPWGESGSRDSVPAWLASGVNQGKSDAEGGLVPTPDPNLPKDGTSGTPTTPPNPDEAPDENKQTATTNCTLPQGGGSGGGCAPIGAGALGVAASLLGGAGFSLPGALNTALAAVTGGTSNVLTQGIANAALTLAGGGNPATAALSAISPTVSAAVQSLGATTGASGLMGTISSAINNTLGGGIPNIANAISGVSNNILGNVSRFLPAFNLATGAAGSASGLGLALNQGVNLLFGNTASRALAAGTGLLGGYHNMYLPEMAGFSIQNLIGPQNVTLPGLTSGIPFAPFGSMFKNYNGMVTQGFGSMTGNLTSLGRDMAELGHLADMTDLFRIGRPGQIINQIINRGAGFTSGVIPAMRRSGLSIADINNYQADEIAQDILSSIRDPNLINIALNALDVKRRVDIMESLGDLTNKEVLFPRSHEQNLFNELNEIAPHLAMCGVGNITNLGEMGRMLQSMETTYTYSALQNEEQPTRLSEIDYLQGQLSPVSNYSGDTDLTVADFLGTAAGYGHTVRLPRINELQELLWADSITTDLQDLINLLEETMAGDYTDSGLGEINVPSAGGYSFGIYYTMDDALADIQNSINDELEYVADNATGSTAEYLFELQNLHNQTVDQLYKEAYLRQQYGITIGSDNKNIQQFFGDGSTLTYTINGTIQSQTDVDVFIDGIKEPKANFSVNTVTSVITFDTAPANNTLIEVTYGNGAIVLTGKASDAWEFAQQIETYANKTGFGREADFLNRIVTDDFHGQRIKATMIQGRNKARAESYGVSCTGDNRLLSDTRNVYPNGLQSFPERTGVWSDDPARAADIWLQIQDPDSTTRDKYYQRRLSYVADTLQADKDRALREVLDALMFVADDQLILTDLGATAYDNVDPYTGRYELNLLDGPTQSQGYVLGPSVELITAILDEEKLFEHQSEYYTNPSEATLAYLESIKIEIPRLVSVLQMTMLSETALTFGLALNDARQIFGVPSVSKILLQNLSQVN